jgi:NhaP-type Na+/H+ and K+/H+ antiporter
VIGVLLGAAAGRAHRRLPGGGISGEYEGIYAIGIALLAYGVADVTWGNGLIAAFVCGIAMAASERDVPEGFADFSENVSTIFQVITFFVFGALIVTTGFHHSVPALVAFILFALLIARPMAVLASFLRTRIPRTEKLFIAWFGPKGVASMLFALLVLKSEVPDAGLVFDVASLTIVTSIAAHGLTDTIGTKWMRDRALLRDPEQPRS